MRCLLDGASCKLWWTSTTIRSLFELEFKSVEMLMFTCKVLIGCVCILRQPYWYLLKMNLSASFAIKCKTHDSNPHCWVLLEYMYFHFTKIEGWSYLKMKTRMLNPLRVPPAQILSLAFTIPHRCYWQVPDRPSQIPLSYSLGISPWIFFFKRNCHDFCFKHCHGC